MTIFEILLPAFVASLILTGIHAYLGVHVVERGVIFVDLSLAQIAALGHHGRVPRGIRHALVDGVRLLARLHAPRRRDLRDVARAPEDAHPAGGDHRDRLRRLGGRRHPRHVEGDARRRST